MAEELGTGIWVAQTTRLDVPRHVWWRKVSEPWISQSAICDVSSFVLITLRLTAKGMGDPSFVTPVPKRCCQDLQRALQPLTRMREYIGLLMMDSALLLYTRSARRIMCRRCPLALFSIVVLNHNNIPLLNLEK